MNKTLLEKPIVLYVDDDEASLKLFKLHYSREYQVFTAKSAKVGLEILKDNDVQIILTDQRMAKITGIEFLAEVKKQFLKPKLILLSAYTDFETLTDAINNIGIWQFVKKPYDPDDLRIVMRNALENYQLLKDTALAEKKLNENEKNFKDLLKS